MKENLQGAAISILAHACVMSLLIIFSFSAQEVPARPVEIDFSMEEAIPAGPESATKRATGNTAAVIKEARPMRHTETTRETAQEDERIEPSPAPAVVAEAARPKPETEPSSSAVIAASLEIPKEMSVGGALQGWADLSGGPPQKTAEAAREAGTSNGSGGAVEGGGATVLQEGEDYNYIRNAVIKDLPYPWLARKRRLEGSLLLSFRVLGNGTIADVKVKESSGHPVLDDNAVAWVSGRVIPRKMPYSVTVDLPINYVLRNSNGLGT